MSREEKGGSTASQKATSIAAVGLFVLRVRVRVVTIAWVLTFQLYSETTKKIKIVSIILKKCLKGFFSASKVCLLKVSSDSSEFKGMCTPKIDKLILWGP